MDQDNALQPKQPTEVTSPTSPTNQPSPNTGASPIPVPTAPQPKKSFLKNPLFWIVIIFLLIFTGAYYFIYSNLEDSVTDLTNKYTPTYSHANTSPTPLTSRPLTTTRIDIPNNEIFDRVTNSYPSEIAWKEKKESVDFGEGRILPAKIRSGTLTFKDKPPDCYLKCEDEYFLKSYGWEQDKFMAADGVTGSLWGYTKKENGTTQLIKMEWESNRGNFEPCPCTYTYTFSMSEASN